MCSVLWVYAAAVALNFEYRSLRGKLQVILEILPQDLGGCGLNPPEAGVMYFCNWK